MDADQISSLVSEVDVGRIKAEVAHLATGQRHSRRDPAHHAATVEHISTALEGYGLSMRHQSFEHGGRHGVNIIGSKEGTSPQRLPPLLVSAHFDTVPDSPGADDNASGIAALLECARILSDVHLNRGIQFVAFDMEEKQPEGGALVGSTAFVKALGVKTSGVKASGGRGDYEALYNLEMVGYTSGPGTQGHPPGFRYILPHAYRWARQKDFTGDFVGVVTRRHDISLGRRFRDAASRWVPALEVLPLEFRHPIPMLYDIFRSDHAPFWAAGIPAVMITDTANFRNPNYHRPTDTPDTLDYAFLDNVTRALVATVAAHAELR